MLRHAFMVALSALIALPAVAKESVPIELPRTERWQVTYDPDACHLTGGFGSGEQRLVARFTQYQPSDEFQLVLLGETVRSNQVQSEIQLNFGLGSKPRKLVGSIGTREKTPLVIVDAIRLSDADSNDAASRLTAEQYAAISGLTFKLRGGKAYRLIFKTMGPPMAAMRACLIDLEKHWGYDPAVLESLSRLPKPISDPARWLSSTDYPLAARMSGHNGIVHFRLDLDDTGRVLKCTIIDKTTPDDFDKATCKSVSQNARIEPALDAAGKPVKSYYINTVRWTMGV